MAETRHQRPPFATPLLQSPRSDVLEWRFPKPLHNLTLVGRSRAAWHTSFVVPQLNLLLDAGLCVNKLRPKHIFLTHGHRDHTLVAPDFASVDDPPDVCCPEPTRQAFDDFMRASAVLNAGGLGNAHEAADAEDKDQQDRRGERMEDKASQELRVPVENGAAPSFQRAAAIREAEALPISHRTRGVVHGDVVPLGRLKNMSATFFDCDHTVPSVGYVFHRTTHRLRPEYTGTAGADLGRLRKTGVAITASHATPMFAFLGDTTAGTLAADPPPPWLCGGIPVVITECSFLWAEHEAQARRTKHTAWRDLEPVVRRWPRTVFVLTHFSMRYSEGEIASFFRDMDDPPANIVVWADGEADGGKACPNEREAPSLSLDRPGSP